MAAGGGLPAARARYQSGYRDRGRAADLAGARLRGRRAGPGRSLPVRRAVRRRRPHVRGSGGPACGPAGLRRPAPAAGGAAARHSGARRAGARGFNPGRAKSPNTATVRMGFWPANSSTTKLPLPSPTSPAALFRTVGAIAGASVNGALGTPARKVNSPVFPPGSSNPTAGIPVAIVVAYGNESVASLDRNFAVAGWPVRMML